MRSVVLFLTKNRHFLQAAEHKTTTYSDHQKLTHFKAAILLNCQRPGSAKERSKYHFDLFYQKWSSTAKVDILSRCQVFTSREGGTTSATNRTMIWIEHWVQDLAMEWDLGEEFRSIPISAVEVEQLLPESKERIKAKAMLHNNYRAWSKQITLEGNTDKKRFNQGTSIVWEEQDIYAWRSTTKDNEIGTQFESSRTLQTERTLELITSHLYWPIMEHYISKLYNDCDICLRQNAPRPVKPSLQNPPELVCKAWARSIHDVVTNLPEPAWATILLVVVNQFSKMAHSVPFINKDSPTVVRAYFENVWNNHGFPEVEVSDRDTVSTWSLFTDLYRYQGIQISMSMTYHPHTDG